MNTIKIVILLGILVIIMLIHYKKNLFEFYNNNIDNKPVILYSYGVTTPDWTDDKHQAHHLIRSCKKNNIKLILEGEGNKWNNLTDKLINMHKFINDLDDDRIVCFVDAYDVMMVDSIDNIKQKFLSFDKPIVISADATCYPDSDVSKFYPERQNISHKYVNSGTYIGYVWALKKMLQTIKKDNYKCKKINIKVFIDDKSIGNDQRCVTSFFLNNQDLCELDYEQKIFSTLWGMSEEDFDFIDYNNVFNKRTNVKTSILHGNGGAWKISTEDYYSKLLQKIKENK